VDSIQQKALQLWRVEMGIQGWVGKQFLLVVIDSGPSSLDNNQTASISPQEGVAGFIADFAGVAGPRPASREGKLVLTTAPWSPDHGDGNTRRLPL